MKLLTITVPCYNSQEYMSKCIESLLPGRKWVEILIVDDGSTDRTAQIADEYASRYPDCVKVIHQANGGHGEAVNTGIRNASGRYFKVVDSDDWLGKRAYFEVLRVLKRYEDDPSAPDLVVSNFIYDKEGSRRKKVMHYRKYLPEKRVFTWQEMRRIPRGKYLLMHALIYRTKVLKESGMRLPAHTFYVDNLYAFEPFPYVKRLYYLDVDLYHYYIGREDQSVHEDVMIRRIDQQLKVNRLMLDFYTGHYDTFRHVKRCRQYLYSYLEIITVISSALLVRSGEEENFAKKKALWKEIRKKNPKLYIRMHYLSPAGALCLPGKAGRKIISAGYRLAHKIYQFN